MYDQAHKLGFHKPKDGKCQGQNLLRKTQNLIIEATIGYKGLKVVTTLGRAP